MNFIVKFGSKVESCWKLVELKWIFSNNSEVSSYLLGHILIFCQVTMQAFQTFINLKKKLVPPILMKILFLDSVRKKLSESDPLSWILVRVKNFILKSLRVESINYCFKSPQPKFQPQIRSIIALLLKNLKEGFRRFIWKIKKLLISLDPKGMFYHTTLKYSLDPINSRLRNSSFKWQKSKKVSSDVTRHRK